MVISSDFYQPIPLRVIIPITTWQDKFNNRPFMVRIVRARANGLKQDSAGNILQVRSVSTQRFIYKIGTVSDQIMKEMLAGLIIIVDYTLDD